MSFKESITRLNELLERIFATKQEEINNQNKLDSGVFALAFSHQIEDVVVLDILLQTEFFKHNAHLFEFFTLDTKKLFRESLEYQNKVEAHFGIEIKSYSAPKEQLERVENAIGEWGMRESLEKRKECCYVRKILPLKEVLAQKILWISGIRVAQSVTRSDTKLFEKDENFGLYKINPIFDWSDSALWEYVEARKLPKNALYAQGFLSIGCSPCTRAVQEGEDIRAGRWWWENPDHKECGLHQRH